MATRDGMTHTMLIVITDYGDLVLDNLVNEVRGWRPTLYRWRSIQSDRRLDLVRSSAGIVLPAAMLAPGPNFRRRRGPQGVA